MVKLTIDGKTVTAREGTTILEAARDNGIHIPSLCYLKDINQIAACRICVVEIEGITRLMPACDNQVAEGMVIRTNSPRVREARRVNLQLILSQHDCRCATCVRSGNCTLQKLANDMNLLSVPYETELPIQRWNQKLPLIRNAAKCVKCMRCVQICDKVQGPPHLGRGRHRLAHHGQCLQEPQAGGGGLRLLRPVRHPLPRWRPL